jgi:hypothetical protein
MELKDVEEDQLRERTTGFFEVSDIPLIHLGC